MVDETKKDVDDVPSTASEPAHIIRTYAQDFAATSGQKMPKPEKKESGPIPVSQATVPEPTSATPIPTPTEPDVPIAAEESSTFNREAILARLHAIQTHTPGNVDNTAVETIEETPQTPEIATVPDTPPEESNTEPSTAPVASERIHTYKSDFADHMSDTGGTTFSVLAAEQNAAGTENVALTSSSKKPWGIILGVIGILLVLGGGAGVYFAYVKSNVPATVPVTLTAPSLIFVDEREQLSGTGTALLTAFANSAQKPLASGNVRLVYVMQDVVTSTGTTTEPAPGGVLIQELNLPAPDILFRNTDPSSTVGVVHAGDETRAFFILRTSSYERTFAGMLSWESTLPQDLSLLYPPYPVPVAPIAIATTSMATSSGKTASSTAYTPQPTRAPTVFRDEVLGNYNVRALKDGTGRTVMLYGYRDKATLIIARDESAFTELANRLSATKTQ